MSVNDNPIGIFDSGVGGLSILQSINALLPREDLIYVADSQYTPYGNKTDGEIESRVLAIAAFLASKNVKCLVVACNTATAAAIHQLRENYSIPIIGLEPALKPAANHSKSKRVGVLATQATLESEKYQQLKRQFASSLKLVEKASPLFVELVENSNELSEKEYTMIEKELTPFREAKIDALVLGCTHYPFLTQAISSIMGEYVTLYESGPAVAKEVKRRLATQLNDKTSQGSIHFFSSAPEYASPQFSQLLNKNIQVSPF
jgi:glutamate racemase